MRCNWLIKWKIIMLPERLTAQLFGKGARRNLNFNFGAFNTQWTLVKK